MVAYILSVKVRASDGVGCFYFSFLIIFFFMKVACFCFICGVICLSFSG